MDKKKDFYVYEWFNIENGEVFYVGKGRGYRYKNVVQRNKYFINYHNKYKCDVRKVRNKLEEDEAFRLEIELIKKYREIGQAKCNIADGGEGCTFPEGSRNDLFRKLQYIHDIKQGMDSMDIEEEYDPKILRLKSTEELKELYQMYINHIESKMWLRENKEEMQLCGSMEADLTGFELKTQNEELIMLSELIANKIATDNKEFSDFLNYKKESDYVCIDFDSDKFLSLMFNNTDYYTELTSITLNILWFMKTIGNQPQLSVFIKIRSYVIKNGYIHIKFNTADDKKTKRVKINLYDIVWGVLMFKDKPLFEIIFGEIFVAPFV